MFQLTQMRSLGDLVGLNVLGTKILVLNSQKAINDLLDKRGNIYSDRPVFTAVGELMGLDKVRIYAPCGAPIFSLSNLSKSSSTVLPIILTLYASCSVCPATSFSAGTVPYPTQCHRARRK